MYLLTFFPILLSCQTQKLDMKTNKKEIEVQRRLSLSNEWLSTADFDGDGDDVIFTFNDGIARWNDKEHEIAAQPLCASVYDWDKDGKEELFVGYGSSRKYRNQPAQVWQYSNQETKLVWKGEIHAMISDMHTTNDGLFIVRSNSNQEMEGGFLDIATGKMNVLHTQKLALRQYPLSNESVLVGRVYGDKPRSDGDLFYSNTKIKIPTKRGVRAIELADINQDQKKDLLISDGWHFQYGTNAQARVVLYEGPDFKERRVIANFDDDYSVNRIEVSDDGKMILAIASKFGYVLFLDDLGWKSYKLPEIGERGSMSFLHSSKGLEIAVSGERGGIFSVSSLSQ